MRYLAIVAAAFIACGGVEETEATYNIGVETGSVNCHDADVVEYLEWGDEHYFLCTWNCATYQDRHRTMVKMQFVEVEGRWEQQFVVFDDGRCS